jgi:hypothetical protein
MRDNRIHIDPKNEVWNKVRSRLSKLLIYEGGEGKEKRQMSEGFKIWGGSIPHNKQMGYGN